MGIDANLSRRRLISGSLVAATVAATAPLLGACGPGGGSSSGGPSSGGPSGGPTGAALPDYLPYAAVRPDAPATDSGAAPYFREFPAEPVAFTNGKPLSGGSVEVLTFLNSTPVPVEQNTWWQAINEALGGTITMSGAPVGNYVAKFQTAVAGDELPDLAVLIPGGIPAIGGLLKAKFADLTPHLAGEAIKDYPGLANIPPVAWRGCVYNKAIQAIPIQRFSLYRCYLTRTDLAAKAGVDPQPRTGADLVALLTALADPDRKRFATASIWGLLDLFLEMHGSPNQWGVAEGVFTRDYETEAFVAGLESATNAWKQGLVHPSAFDANISLQIQEMYNNGTIGFVPTPASWAGNAVGALKVDPAATSTALKVNTWDGSAAAGRWLNNGAPYLAAIPKADPERVKEILRVANWLASPFGTKEYLLFQNGIEGADYTVGSDGAFVQTDQGKANKPAGLSYAGAPAMVHFSAGHPDVAKAEYEAEVLGMETAVPLPTVGLSSPTDESKGAALSREMKDLQADIIQGRQELSAWQEAVKAWRNKGGDAIRGEYEKAHAEQG